MLRVTIRWPCWLDSRYLKFTGGKLTRSSPGMFNEQNASWMAAIQKWSQLFKNVNDSIWKMYQFESKKFFWYTKANNFRNQEVCLGFFQILWLVRAGKQKTFESSLKVTDIIWMIEYESYYTILCLANILRVSFSIKKYPEPQLLNTEF